MKLKLTKNFIPIILSLFTLFLLCGCEQKDGGGFFLDGHTQLNLYGGDKIACQNDIYDFLRDFENNISVNIATSEVALFNAADKNEKIFLSEHIYNVFKLSLQIYDDTEGAFNFCLYDLSLLWGFFPDNNDLGIIPSQTEIDALMPYANPSYIVIDDSEKSVYKTENGVKVDFGGIAKGYALNVCREIAQKHAVTGGTINITGNVYGIGQFNNKGLETPKKIGIEDPRAFENNNRYFCALFINDSSVSVSGDYQRFFINDESGIRYCHIVNPYTGSPVQNNITSVVIVHQNAAAADAYSTAVMVSGISGGIALMEQNNLSGIIIAKEKHYYVSGNLNINEVFSGYEKKYL